VTQRLIRDAQDLKLLLRYLETSKLPMTVTEVRGKPRSIEQNRLNRLWCNEIAEQLGDVTAENVRGLLKLQFAVPILRAENEAFREKYDRIVKPLPYETKLELMQEPLDFPCTRLLTTAQFTRYIDDIYSYFTKQGLKLTEPPDKISGPKIGVKVDGLEKH
jgi:hypothetical protein